ncbi:MAG: ABC transporter ATP-binding protein [Candidatus Bathyarchaeia archaeon]
MFEVELIDVVKRFGAVTAVDHVSLGVRKNEFYSFLGPSGCGKTTTLRIIAGFEEPDEGTLKLGDTVANDIPPYKRNVGMVFQHLALFPHMSVFDNIAFGLKMAKAGKDEIRKKVDRSLELVGLPDFGNRRINQLSGGQQQRVGIARAMVKEPEVLLLDEPLGPLDLKIRQHMQLELKRIQKQVGTTFIYVTHDQGEALTMSDNIAVINVGRVEQIGTPREIYDRPKTQFVANFIGETNFLDGDLRVSAEFECKSLPHAVSVEEEWLGEGVLSIRPERVSIGPDLKGLDNLFDARIEDFVYQGSHVSVSARVGDNLTMKIRANPTVPLKIGEKTRIGWNKTDATVIKLENS